MKKVISFSVTAVFGLLVMANTALAASPLVDVAWVKEHSCDSNVRVLQTSFVLSKADYLTGHIPCAVYTNYGKDGWRETLDGVRGMLPSADKLETLIGSLGIDNDTHVVLYASGESSSDLGTSTRIYWTFVVMSHDNVSVLNGGWKAYAADENNPVEKGENTVAAKTFNATFRPELQATKDQAAAASTSGGVLVNNLSDSSYLFRGTIPTSKSIPGTWFTSTGGVYRPVGQLKQIFAHVGVPTTGKQIFFCGSGHLATLGWFASYAIMGNNEASMFDGSMTMWRQDTSLPVETKISLN